MFTMQGKVLLLSPHTDDIELCAGGTCARWVREKQSEIYWVVFSVCRNAVPAGLPEDTLQNEFIQAADSLGINNREIGDLPNRYLPDHWKDVLSTLNRIRNDFAPDIVVMPSLTDVHQDHRTVAEQALRVFGKNATLLGYEAPWGDHDFRPQLYVPLSEEDMAKKWDVLSQYKSQFTLSRTYFTREFIFGWASMRGVQCNSQYAEAFQLLRGIVDR